MGRYALIGVVAGGLLLGAVAGALAEPRSSTLRVLAENPKARFNPRVQVLLVEERLIRPEPVEIYPSSLTYQQGSAGVDAQIRRLGELIRREGRE